MSAATLDKRARTLWLRAGYLLFGVGPWLFLLGYTAWEVFVPLCDPMREMWPPPNAAGHWAVFFGGPWLVVIAALTVGLRAAGRRVSELALISVSAALGACLILIITQPFATSHAQEATRVECEHIRLLQGSS